MGAGKEKNSLSACRNFLQERFYREQDYKKRLKLEQKVDGVNKPLGISSKNLLDA